MRLTPWPLCVFVTERKNCGEERPFFVTKKTEKFPAKETQTFPLGGLEVTSIKKGPGVPDAHFVSPEVANTRHEERCRRKEKPRWLVGVCIILCLPETPEDVPADEWRRRELNLSRYRREI